MGQIKKYLLALLTVLVAALVGCANPAKNYKVDAKFKSGESLTIHTITDVHYLSPSLKDKGEAFKKYVSSGDGKQLFYIHDLVNALTDNIESTNPDILIISGDLTNNGEKQSHIDLSKKLKAIETSGTSVYVIPGNHDISNPWARRFRENKQFVTDTISPKDFSEIYAEFGYDEAMLRDEDTLSYLATPSEDLWLLMLDTNKYNNNMKLGYPEGDGELTEHTIKWIKKCLALAKNKGAYVLPVMHHNIVNHSDVIRRGYTLNNNEEVLNIFKQNKVTLVLSGHIHIQDISSDDKNGHKLYDIATGSLAVYPHQHGILKYAPKDKTFDYSTSWVNLEKWSKKQEISDDNLNNFKTYSKTYFGRFAYDMAYKHLIKDNNLSHDEIKSMSETMKILNLRYFAGQEHLNEKDVLNTEGFNLWSHASEGFLKNYIWSISTDKDTDDHHLKIKLGQKNTKTN